MRPWYIVRVVGAIVFVLAIFASALLMTPRKRGVEAAAENLMVVLRESADTDHDAGVLAPTGKVHATLGGGAPVEVELAWFRLLGDMDVRFIFLAGLQVRYATPRDLARLNLTTEQALVLAVDNLKRIHGKPTAQPFRGGLQQVRGAPPYLSGGYLLDLPFWNGLLLRHPYGIVAALPRRGEPP